jgi:hypothetical protein
MCHFDDHTHKLGFANFKWKRLPFWGLVAETMRMLACARVLQLYVALTVLALAAQAVEELPDVTLFGAGIGVVLLASLGAIALLICCIGRTTAQPW